MEKETEMISCKDVENYLQPYLEDKLNFSDTKVLLEHLKDCRECMDELEIRYLLYEGLKRLEKGHNLNLKAELEERIYRSGQHVLMIERLKTSAAMLFLALAVFGVVQGVLMIVQ